MELLSSDIELESVIVSDIAEDFNISSIEMSTAKLDMSKVTEIPTFLGENDIIKAIQLLPGVSSVGEGASGFNVRGGSVGQNLVLLDEAPVYNSSHLLGFLSVFNPDAVKDLKLYKGGIPSRYGGRISSILDIRMKDGNKKNAVLSGGIGTIFSRLTLESPIIKDKSSFILALRRSYADILAKPFLKNSNFFDDGAALNFYDLTAKSNFELNDNNTIYISSYIGRDVFKFDARQGFNWGNKTGTIRWNHLFNDKLFVNTSLIFTDYRFQFNIAQSDFEFKIYTGINDWNTKVDFLYQPNQRNTIRFGTNYTYHKFIPGNATGRSGEVEFAPDEVYTQYSNEGALYFSNDIELSDEIKAHLGLRYSSFQYKGNITFREYIKSDLTGENDNYRNIEPRASLRYRINTNNSIKMAFTQNYQYIHLASLSSLSLPADLWVPSSKDIKPKFSTQYALGYFKNFN